MNVMVALTPDFLARGLPYAKKMIGALTLLGLIIRDADDKFVKDANTVPELAPK